ncbi:MAG: hypothetical protein P8174_10510 [Gemmatimonadota bacterium]
MLLTVLAAAVPLLDRELPHGVAVTAVPHASSHVYRHDHSICTQHSVNLWLLEPGVAEAPARWAEAGPEPLPDHLPAIPRAIHSPRPRAPPIV